MFSPEERTPDYSGMRMSTGYMEKKPSGIIPLYSEGSPDYRLEEVEEILTETITEIYEHLEGGDIFEDLEYILSNEEMSVTAYSPEEAEALIGAGFEVDEVNSEVFSSFSDILIARFEYRSSERRDTVSMFKPGRILVSYYDIGDDELRKYIEDEFPEEEFMDENF